MNLLKSLTIISLVFIILYPFITTSYASSYPKCNNISPPDYSGMATDEGHDHVGVYGKIYTYYMDYIQVAVIERLYLIRIVGGWDEYIYFELGISWDSSNYLFIYWRYSGEEYEYGYIPDHYIQDAYLYQWYTLHIKKKVGEETYIFYVNGVKKATVHQDEYAPYDGFGVAESYTNDCCAYPPQTTMKAHFKDLKFGYISRGIYRLQYWNNVSYCVDPPFELIPFSSYEFEVMPIA